jgi:signal transduction histidine kinase/CheY-like chemotaxis protein
VLDGSLEQFALVYPCHTLSEPRWFQMRVAPLPAQAGAVAIHSNITELVLAKEAAEAANRAKSTFLSIMSHEVRTPMHGVMGMLQILQSTNLSAEQKEFVDLALHSSRNLLRILSDILDLSRIEAGALVLHDELFAPGELVRPVIGSLTLQAEAKKLDLVVDLDPSLPATLRGDPGRIRQLLFNLLSNSIKYSDRGQIRLVIDAPTRGARPGQVCLRLVVSDAGAGIPAEKLRTVFDPFTQVDGSYTRRHGGVGLGLSIVNRLVTLMDGSVEVRSEVGRGTEIQVSLRLKPVVEASPPTARPESQAVAAGSGAILVVEDDPIIRKAVVRQLEHLGYDVAQAADGAEGLALLERERFDVVLMDVEMPVLDGLEATRRIRASRTGRIDPDIPIVALTAHAMAGDGDRFMSAGMSDYLSKPLEPEDLSRVLARLLPVRERREPDRTTAPGDIPPGP